MKPIKVIFTVIFVFLLVVIFRPWFLSSEIIGGDWPFYFNETLEEFTFFPLSWNAEYNNGLGGTDTLYFLNIYQSFTVLLTQIFHIPWVFIYKVFWFGSFIALSIISITVFLKTILPNAKFWQIIIGGVIFVSNTYILMVVGGGQMGVALAYAVSPLVLARFIKLFDIAGSQDHNLQLSLIASLILALQVMFDPRITYITLIAIFLYYLLRIFLRKSVHFIYSIIIPIGVTLLLHASWILPLLFFRQNPIGHLGVAYTNTGIVEFLSFANFSNALALLHPNWPDNIFGKTYFLQPAFLLLPILAFSAFILFQQQRKNTIHEHSFFKLSYFALLGLLGAFLAKGTNPPFDGLYIWMFDHIPAFVLFRDPTKFYLLIILSYSFLIPFSLGKMADRLLQVRLKIPYLYIMLPFAFLLFWIFLIRPSVVGQLSGTFLHRDVPIEYIKLKDFLHSKPEFFRVLWVPRRERFNYYTNNHLATESDQLFGTRDMVDIVKKLNTTETKEYIAALGVSYVVVPFDPFGEIFVKDREYDSGAYEETIDQLAQVSWLSKIDGFGKTVLFKTQTANDRFWLSKGGRISYLMVNPVTYKVIVQISEPQELNFSESYNPSWVVKSDSFKSISQKTNWGLNSFVLPSAGSYTITVSFMQQQYYEFGQMISLITLVSVVIIIFVFPIKKV